MLYVFVDESGDLGFTKKSSKYFVIASVETTDDKQFDSLFKKVRKSLKKKERDIPEFKFTKTNQDTKLKILSKIAELDVSFSAVVLDKNTVAFHLRTKQQILYNYLTGFIVEILPVSRHRRIKLVIDKFLTNEVERSNFDEYILQKVEEVCLKHGIIVPEVRVNHASSQSHCGLQVADFVAGSIFNKYERGYEKYYTIIKPKIDILKERFKR